MSRALTSAVALQVTRICSIESKGAGQGHRSQAGLLVGLSLASFHLLYTLGKSCQIWQFLKVSIELRTLAVLWTLFCVDRTADLSSFMDTFSMFTKLPDLGSFMDTFQTQ